MAEDKIQTPSSSAGLIRFYDVAASKVQIDAKAVIGLSVVVILLELVLQIMLK